MFLNTSSDVKDPANELVLKLDNFGFGKWYAPSREQKEEERRQGVMPPSSSGATQEKKKRNGVQAVSSSSLEVGSVLQVGVSLLAPPPASGA